MQHGADFEPAAQLEGARLVEGLSLGGKLAKEQSRGQCPPTGGPLAAALQGHQADQHV